MYPVGVNSCNDEGGGNGATAIELNAWQTPLPSDGREGDWPSLTERETSFSTSKHCSKRIKKVKSPTIETFEEQHIYESLEGLDDVSTLSCVCVCPCVTLALNWCSTGVHWCPLVFHGCPLVSTGVLLVSTGVHWCSTDVHWCSTGVHWCSRVSNGVFMIFYWCSTGVLYYYPIVHSVT